MIQRRVHTSIVILGFALRLLNIEQHIVVEELVIEHFIIILLTHLASTAGDKTPFSINVHLSCTGCTCRFITKQPVIVVPRKVSSNLGFELGVYGKKWDSRITRLVRTNKTPGIHARL